MKRIKDAMNRTSWGWIVALGMVPLLISGCKGAAQLGDRPPSIKASNWDMMIHTDPDTGCQYLRLENSGRELAPRIAADGKTHMGCREVRP